MIWGISEDEDVSDVWGSATASGKEWLWDWALKDIIDNTIDSHNIDNT